MGEQLKEYKTYIPKDPSDLGYFEFSGTNEDVPHISIDNLKEGEEVELQMNEINGGKPFLLIRKNGKLHVNWNKP